MSRDVVSIPLAPPPPTSIHPCVHPFAFFIPASPDLLLFFSSPFLLLSFSFPSPFLHLLPYSPLFLPLRLKSLRAYSHLSPCPSLHSPYLLTYPRDGDGGIRHEAFDQSIVSSIPTSIFVLCSTSTLTATVLTEPWLCTYLISHSEEALAVALMVA
ncbi:hypothetical protein TcWFU_006983 [Taenia crassiceps]|uniref:Uncharacterized protein n=1 Tax=Taenia crassiceps TaxID=6207 RepID=A0ABR4Q6X7_9CEST